MAASGTVPCIIDQYRIVVFLSLLLLQDAATLVQVFRKFDLEESGYVTNAELRELGDHVHALCYTLCD